MGKQVRFYMTEQDEDDFMAFVRTTGDVVIMPQTSDSNVEEVYTSFSSLAGRRLGERCHLWNRSISPKPQTEYVDAHGGCYCLDFLQSEVINVLQSKLVDKRLSMGRLHIESLLRLPDGSTISKSSDFLRWYDELRRWLVKRLPTVFDTAYASSRVVFLKNSGIELTGHIL